MDRYVIKSRSTEYIGICDFCLKSLPILYTGYTIGFLDLLSFCSETCKNCYILVN
jgi:hypothetical protein